MSNKIYHDKVRLGSAFSLKVGNSVEKLNNAILSKVMVLDADTAELGLFDTATPNFNTYYPGVKPEDLKVNDADYINPVFRALSEVIVHKNVNPIDFAKNGVLKASMNKLKGQTVYPNHEPSVGNEIGVVANVAWQESYTTKSGIIVPAGINATFKIDAKANPKIARSILMDPPAIHSNSVTVSFGWEQSHASMEIRDFMSKIGQYGADGQLIRRIVTEIKNYHETSLVSHGADPFATQIKDGEMVNPEYASSTYSLAANGKEKPKSYYFNYREDITSLSAADSTLDEPNNINHTQTMKDLIATLAAKYKKPEAEITEAFIQSLIESGELAITNLATATEANKVAVAATAAKQTELDAKVTEVATLTTALDAEKVKATTATTKLATFEPLATEYTTKLRDEVKRVYGILKADKADATILASFETAETKQLNALMAEYNTELEKSFPASCKSCGSHEITRNTASILDPSGDKGAGKSKPSTEEELRAEIRKENKAGYIFEGK